MSSREDLITEMATAMYAAGRTDDDITFQPHYDGQGGSSIRPGHSRDRAMDRSRLSEAVLGGLHITDKIRAEHYGVGGDCVACPDGYLYVSWPCRWVTWADMLDAEMGVTR